MQTWMGLSTDESHTDETEDMLRIAGVTNGAPENGTSIGDLVMFDILSRITIGETLESETG